MAVISGQSFATERSALRSSVKVGVAVLGSPSLIILLVSVDVKQHWTMYTHWSQFVPNMSTRHPRTLSSISSSLCSWFFRSQELCESRGGHPGLPDPNTNSPYSLCGRKATFNEPWTARAQELCESRGGRPGLPVANRPYSFYGRWHKATLNSTVAFTHATNSS